MRVIGITPINNDLKEEKSMKFLQKLGKALMLPVAVLPICGILIELTSFSIAFLIIKSLHKF